MIARTSKLLRFHRAGNSSAIACRFITVVLMACGLLACSPEPETSAQAPQPARADSAPSQPSAKPAARELLATWQSFSYAPPQYAVETLLIYNDFSCTISTQPQHSNNPGQWKRIDDDQLQFSFPNSQNTITASLRQANSIEGKQQPGKAGYLWVTLTDDKKQLFVLAGSPDATMVRESIDGESLWAAGQRQQGLEKLNSALQRGSVWARLRLGWLYATTQEILQPALALKLLLPLRNNRSYTVQTALASAYAANGEFPTAIERATLACSLSNERDRAGCEQRLAGYREQQASTASP